MLNLVQQFVSLIMKNNYVYDETNTIMKYHNIDYDLLVLKKKNGDIDTCMIIDKRIQQPVYYTDIKTAIKKLGRNKAVLF